MAPPPTPPFNASLLLRLRRLRQLLPGPIRRPRHRHAPSPREIRLRPSPRSAPPLPLQRRRKRPREPPSGAGGGGRQNQRPRRERNLGDSTQVGELRKRMEAALVRATRWCSLLLQDSRSRQDRRQLRNREGIESHRRRIRAHDFSQPQFQSRRQPSPQAPRRNPSQGPFLVNFLFFHLLPLFTQFLFLFLFIFRFNFASVSVTTLGEHRLRN